MCCRKRLQLIAGKKKAALLSGPFSLPRGRILEAVPADQPGLIKRIPGTSMGVAMSESDSQPRSRLE